ncbi:MAG TPA: hypothetical protein VHA78_05585 [Candidatus Peribacteraceae bacterium]|nr:hypothetical protein [Candidatus Peribacteraceae bacterium]
MNNAPSMPEAFNPEQSAELDRLSGLVSNVDDREEALQIADEGNAEVRQAYENQIAHMQEGEEQLKAFALQNRVSAKAEEKQEHEAEMQQAESIDFNA